jgi:hypothetical protein
MRLLRKSVLRGGQIASKAVVASRTINLRRCRGSFAPDFRAIASRLDLWFPGSSIRNITHSVRF